MCSRRCAASANAGGDESEHQAALNDYKENKFAFATFALRSLPESGIVQASHRFDTDGTARRMDDGQGLPNRQGNERPPLCVRDFTEKALHYLPLK